MVIAVFLGFYKIEGFMDRHYKFEPNFAAIPVDNRTRQGTHLWLALVLPGVKPTPQSIKFKKWIFIASNTSPYDTVKSEHIIKRLLMLK